MGMKAIMENFVNNYTSKVGQVILCSSTYSRVHRAGGGEYRRVHLGAGGSAEYSRVWLVIGG